MTMTARGGEPVGAGRGAHRLQSDLGEDLTYVATQEGWLYVAVILDLGVAAWWVGARADPPSCLVVAALQMALKHRQPPRGLLHHSDRGVQYASAEHRAVLAAAGLEPSMSRAGNPYDNAAMESFMATYKRECVVGLTRFDGHLGGGALSTDRDASEQSDQEPEGTVDRARAASQAL